jgi:ATP-dependent DNA helicase RecG
VVTLWRDWLTAEAIAKLGLNDRQMQGIHFLKIHGKISNSEYQQVANCIKKTATRDLNNMKGKGIIEQIGNRGPSVHYVIAKKRDKKGTKET